jgi:uncharacterized protein YdhG (YjbR/CyaY superfamily)
MTNKIESSKPSGKALAAGRKSDGFSDEELAAMKDRIKEQQSEVRGGRQDTEGEVLAKITELSEPERSIAQRLHAIIKEAGPQLVPKTWYGMPAYSNNGKVVVFFQSASKFKTRYMTLGFSDSAALDDGEFWPVSFALKELTPAVEDRIRQLVKKAVK